MQFEWPKTGFRLSSDKTDLRPKSYTKFQISCLISLANADNLKIYQRFVELSNRLYFYFYAFVHGSY